MNKVLVIVGPTASGKSDLAVKIAKKFKGEVISADSRQVYKGLDIGTGKIVMREMQGVPHHMLSVANPKKRFSVSEYQKLAMQVLKKIERPVVVGGTGLYIDALAGIQFPEVPPNKKLRAKLEKKSVLELFKILKKKDPRRAKSIDAKNKVRLVRALEIIEKLGKVPDLKTSNSKNFIYIGLKPKNLDERIEKRVKQMFKNGLLKEILKLKKAGVSNKRLKELGFEYSNPTEESVTTASKQYAKRQMTWFKRNKKITWYPSAQTAYAASVRKLGGEK